MSSAATWSNRRRLLRQHAEEVEQLIAARHAELGWTANDDGCGAVISLGRRKAHQKHCYRGAFFDAATCHSFTLPRETDQTQTAVPCLVWYRKK
eukprot:COSAG06_NODE_3068_length_5896_cov_126.296360_5_plen_94_part_00